MLSTTPYTTSNICLAKARTSFCVSRSDHFADLILRHSLLGASSQVSLHHIILVNILSKEVELTVESPSHPSLAWCAAKEMVKSNSIRIIMISVRVIAVWMGVTGGVDVSPPEGIKNVTILW